MSFSTRRSNRSMLYSAAGGFDTLLWQPPADLYRVPRGWLVKFDLAGVRPEELEIRVQGCRLTVRGSRRDLHIEEGASCYSMEIAYSDFERTIEFPCELEQAEVAWEYRDGMLLVRMLTEEAK